MQDVAPVGAHGPVAPARLMLPVEPLAGGFAPARRPGGPTGPLA